MQVSWGLLAVLRFFLAFVVIVGHLNEMIKLPFPLETFSKLGGFQAVVGFLLLSGFSIGASIQKNPQDFYKKRFFRIYPVYIVCFIIVIFVKINDLNSDSIWIIVANLFFLQGFVTPWSILGPSWSLSLEVWLYALAPYFKKMKFTYLIAFIAASFICFAAYSLIRVRYGFNYHSEAGYGINLFTLSFIWLAGFVYVMFEEKRKQLFALIIALLFGQLLIRAFILFAGRFNKGQLDLFISEDLNRLFFNAILMLIVGVTFYVAIKPIHIKKKINIVFNYLGDISYPLYLIHMPVYLFLNKYQVANWYWYISLSIIMAAIIYRSVDFYSQKRHKVETKSNI
jgi:peptidoglycan/LPS O-acetylase OafA/YrhL